MIPFALGLSILGPLAGILVLLAVSRFPRLQPVGRYAAPAGAVLSFIGVSFIPLEPHGVSILSRWSPSFFFRALPALQMPPDLWPLMLTLSCATVASNLVQMSRIPRPRFLAEIAGLGMLAAGLIALAGENLLTVLVAWACFDLAWAAGALASDVPAQRVAKGAALNMLTLLVLWSGALFVEGHHTSLSWRLMDMVEPGKSALLIAGLGRLGLYPVHLAVPWKKEQDLPAAIPILLGPVLGWGLLVRLATVVGNSPFPSWVEGAAVVTLIAGGLGAFLRAGKGGWPWLSMAAVGMVVWAAARAGDAAPQILALGSVGWTLGVVLMGLDRGLNRREWWWSIPTGLGGIALMGGPPAWVPTSFLTASLAASPSAWRLAAFMAGQALLAGAAGRRLLRPAPQEEPAGPLSTVARAAGLAPPTLLLLAGGLYTGLMTPSPFNPLGWGMWAAGTALGIPLVWWRRRLRKRRSTLGILYSFLRLDWLTQLVLDSMGQMTVLLKAVADVAEGPGAVLWALAVLLLILQVVAGR